MADGDQYPLLRLGTPRKLPRKKRKPNFPPPPPRDVNRHGRALLAGADLARQRVADAAAISRDLATDVPYVRIQHDPRNRVTDDGLVRMGLVPVMHRQDHVIAAYATDAARNAPQEGRRVSTPDRQARHAVVHRDARAVDPG
jgi:hypothetical protein